MSVLIILVLQITPNENLEKLIWQLTEKKCKIWCILFQLMFILCQSTKMLFKVLVLVNDINPC